MVASAPEVLERCDCVSTCLCSFGGTGLPYDFNSLMIWEELLIFSLFSFYLVVRTEVMEEVFHSLHVRLETRSLPKSNLTEGPTCLQNLRRGWKSTNWGVHWILTTMHLVLRSGNCCCYHNCLHLKADPGLGVGSGPKSTTATVPSAIVNIRTISSQTQAEQQYSSSVVFVLSSDLPVFYFVFHFQLLGPPFPDTLRSCPVSLLTPHRFLSSSDHSAQSLEKCSQPMAYLPGFPPTACLKVMSVFDTQFEWKKIHERAKSILPKSMSI
jgi:hypothetical protein